MDVSRIREDFPLLKQTMMGHPLIYMDNAATTLKPRCVIDAVTDYYTRLGANAHRGDYALSAQVDEAFEAARARVAQFLNAKSSAQIVFTSGTSASLNQVASGYARKILKEGDVILSTVAEHASSILPFLRAAKETGARMEYIELDADGRVTLEHVQRSLHPRVRMIVLAQVSNVLGQVAPVADICRIAHAQGICVVVDGAQSTPHMRIDVQQMDCDFFAFSAHKLCGPTGVGVLYVVSLSSPFLLSHLMDNVVRNQLMVIDGEGKRINLYGYIRQSWGLSICGTPKSYVTVPKEKAALDDQQLAALLLSETIYEEGEDFSRLVDREIISKAEAPFGSGQYDIAYVGVSLNTFIQFYPSYRGTVEYRLFWNSVTAFYIELILFEEAAINRFNKALVSLMSEANEDLPEDFLEKNRKITNEFLSTVEFWDVQLNYPSSQKSISMIRDAFAQKTLLARMARYQEQVKNIFEINKELIDRRAEKEEKKSNDRMNFILFILTVVSTVSAVYQTVDYVMAYMADDPVRNIFPLLTNIVILAFVGLLYRIKYR